jgi:hypothetical protein
MNAGKLDNTLLLIGGVCHSYDAHTTTFGGHLRVLGAYGMRNGQPWPVS